MAIQDTLTLLERTVNQYMNVISRYQEFDDEPEFTPYGGVFEPSVSGLSPEEIKGNKKANRQIRMLDVAHELHETEDGQGNIFAKIAFINRLITAVKKEYPSCQAIQDKTLRERVRKVLEDAKGVRDDMNKILKSMGFK
ncbi:MAG: hypothetical protein WCF19_08395 [Chlamydiales bacterium]